MAVEDRILSPSKLYARLSEYYHDPSDTVYLASD
jgi:hypothetical protein